MTIKFRAWHKIDGWSKGCSFGQNGLINYASVWLTPEKANMEIMQYIGLTDIEEKEWYVGDIGEFENGDRFVIKMEQWLEAYLEPIGEPKCEDLMYLEHVHKAKIIGNIYQNQNLINS